MIQPIKQPGSNARQSEKLACTLLALSSIIGAARAQVTMRVSVGSAGGQANGPSDLCSISSDGRYVLFRSGANNLPGSDAMNHYHVFLRDRQSGTTRLIDVSADGTPSARGASPLAISPDGRYAVFQSLSRNLDPSGANGIFRYDIESGRVTLVVANTMTSTERAFTAGGSFSGDSRIFAYGRYVIRNGVFYSSDINVVDLSTGIDVAIRPAAGNQFSSPSISANGRYVAFQSGQTPLTTVLIWDRSMDVLLDAVRAVDGGLANGTVFGPNLSADGRYLLFTSYASNLVAGDSNNVADAFVRDLQATTTTRVSVDSVGAEADGWSNAGAITADGRWVAFTSMATNLVPADTNDRYGTAAGQDVFLHNRITGVTTRVSVSSSGGQANDWSVTGGVTLSHDAWDVVFTSLATNLVEADTNGVGDVFVFTSVRTTASSVSPVAGPLEGGDVVYVLGSNFTNVADTRVTFGDAPAIVTQVESDRMAVQTPPGIGAVDVRVWNSNGSDVIPAGYHYVEPLLAARYGNVNAGAGAREDVLLVNALAGDPVTREVQVAVDSRIVAVITAPSSRRTARYAVYAWAHTPSASTLVSLPGQVGRLVFPIPLTGGSPQPLAIWNNLGSRGALGAPTQASSPAPSTLFRVLGGTRRRINVTLQGLIEDDGSVSVSHVSVTNAVIVRIE